jgi:hypothetical protein
MVIRLQEVMEVVAVALPSLELLAWVLRDTTEVLELLD